MSYVVEVIRPIQKKEVLTLIHDDAELTIIAEGENWIDFTWSRGGGQVMFNFAQGRISVTTPGEEAWAKAQALAERLEAAVIGEEDDLPNRREIKQGLLAGRSTWIGWPILVVLLGGLLAWKW